MNILEIKTVLKANHSIFQKYVMSLNETDFVFSPNEKWSAGMQLEHIIKSVKPLNLAFGLPKFILKWKFGIANRPSKTYEALVLKYQDKLKTVIGGAAPKRFSPSKVTYEQQDSKCKELIKTIEKLCNKVGEFSEEDLDKYIIPHPLLGKLTVREMLYFTMYHVQHHQAIIKAQLQA